MLLVGFFFSGLVPLWGYGLGEQYERVLLDGVVLTDLVGGCFR